MSTITLIRPKQRLSLFEWKELAEYRDLLYYLSLRDIKLRYKQTSLGIAWVILQPLVQAVIFAVLFGNFGRLPSSGQPYLLMVFTGLVPWGLFSNCIGRATGSLVANANLLSKIYFPRLIIPLASVASVVVDTLVSFGVMLVLLLVFRVQPGFHFIAAAFFLSTALLMSLGLSLVAASLNVFRRDVGYAVPFVLQVLYYMTPVVYAIELIPEKWRFLYSLNPVVGIVAGFRWSVLGGAAPTPVMLGSMTGGLILSLLAGMALFQRIEHRFADIV